MSGICGILSLKNDDSIDKNVLFKMGKTIKHRGIDDFGYFIDKKLVFITIY